MKQRALLVAAAVAGALILRLALISTRGDFLEFDETFYLLIARSLAEGKGYAMNGLPQVAFPPLPAYLLLLFQKIFGTMIVPSRIASAIFGALLVPVAFRVASRCVGRRAALIASVFVAVCPSLMSFLPVRLPAYERLDFGYDSIYVLLAYTTLWALLGFIRRPSLPKGIALGAACGLAYLMRNESVLIGAGSIAIATIAAATRKSNERGGADAATWRSGGAAGPAPAPPRREPAVAWALVAGLVFAAVAAPFVLYLHGVTGRWSVSGKTGTAALIRPTVVAWVRDNDFYSYEKALYALAPSGDRMLSSYWGYEGHQYEGSLGLTAAGVRDNLEVYVTILIPTLLPWITWPFLALGGIEIASRGLGSLGRSGSRHGPPPDRREGTLTLASLLLLPVPSLVICLLLFVEPRHHLYLVPLALMVAAAGVVRAARWIPMRRGRAVLAGIVAAVLLAQSLRPLVLLRTDDQIRPEATKVRAMGEQLDRELRPNEPVASYHPALAFWARRQWRVLPAAAFPQIVAYALRRGITTLVLERGVFGPPPGEPAGPGPSFAVYRIASGITPEEADRSIYRIERLEQNDLFGRYAIEGVAAR